MGDLDWMLGAPGGDSEPDDRKTGEAINKQYDADDVNEILRRYQPATPPVHPTLDAVGAFAATLETVLEEGDWARVFFLTYVSDEGKAIASRAYRAAGVTKKVYERRLSDDGVFAALQSEANMLWLETVEYEMHHRLVHGTAKPVVARGRIIEYVREVNDGLLMWYLERLAPEKYHLATKMEVTSKDAPTRFKFAMGEAGDSAGELASGDETSGE